jgi:hypothetical protein
MISQCGNSNHSIGEYAIFLVTSAPGWQDIRRKSAPTSKGWELRPRRRWTVRAARSPGIKHAPRTALKRSVQWAYLRFSN